MAIVPGQNLADVTRENPLPVQKAAECVTITTHMPAPFCMS